MTQSGWVTLLYSRNWHNIVNQLYFNKNERKKKRKEKKRKEKKRKEKKRKKKTKL